MNQSLYTRCLDFFIRRFFAFFAVGLGLFLTAITVPCLLPGGQILLNGEPTDAWLWRIVGSLAPSVLIVLGVVLYKAKPLKL